MRVVIKRRGRRTWGRGVAIGTAVIAGDGANEVTEGSFIALLLALADTTNAIRHDEKGVDTTVGVELNRGGKKGPGRRVVTGRTSARGKVAPPEFTKLFF